MFEPRIVVSDVVDRGVEALIGDGLDRYNEQVAGSSTSTASARRSPYPAVSGKVVGGATGRSSLGAGIGSRVLRAFEDEGRRRGCRSAVLYTISFQAPGFYARHGWQAFGEVACDPEETSRIFMSKRL